MRRFVQHILPARFVSIRHYGILSSAWKRGKLQQLQQELKISVKPLPAATTKFHRCPYCKIGMLVTMEVFGKRGPPEHYLPERQPVPVS